jgi:hypothetical protein
MPWTRDANGQTVLEKVVLQITLGGTPQNPEVRFLSRYKDNPRQ